MTVQDIQQVLEDNDELQKINYDLNNKLDVLLQLSSLDPMASTQQLLPPTSQ